MSDTTPLSSPIRTTTHAEYLQYLLGLAVQQFGANAPATRALAKELEEAQKAQSKPAKEHRYQVGFR